MQSFASVAVTALQNCGAGDVATDLLGLPGGTRGPALKVQVPVKVGGKLVTSDPICTSSLGSLVST